jgi:two-component system phosphate regulon sensor histidine kinase PhoR
MHKRRLWWRLFVAYLWVPVVVLLTIGGCGSGIVRQLYVDQLENDLEARARLCEKQLGDQVAQGQPAQVDRLCKELGRAANMRITVVALSGRVVGDSEANPLDMDNHKLRPEVRDALGGLVGRSIRYSSTEQEDHIYLAIPLRHDERTIGVLRTSLPLTALTRTLAIVRNRIAIAILIGILIHGAVTLLISRRMSRPLEEIKAGAERFAAGDLDYRLRIADSVEMDTVAETMNRMAEQLRERIQTVLHQQNEREAMLASMEEGVLAVDSQGTILSLNQACAHLLGEEPVQLQGRSVYEAIRKVDVLDFIDSALASPSPVEGELQIRGAQDRWVSARGTLLHGPHGSKMGVLVVLHDVTRLRHLEEVRRDFVANVSHELRTPITSIKGFVETLLEGALEDQHNAYRFLQIMSRQVNRLDAIIRDLLVLSRIERGFDEQRIELATESIREVLHAAIEMCEKKASDKGVKIELVCPDDLTGDVNAALLEQAVVNLVDNAIKYSGPDGAIEVSAAAANEEILIRVKDQGCGIEPQHLPRLFERFYRVDRARSREMGGTGLGLAIVRHIALAHRGSVSVESTVGGGSTFELRLPR